MLRFLCAHGVYQEVADSKDTQPHFTLTNLSNLVRTDVQSTSSSIQGYIDFLNEDLWKGVLSLGECLMSKEDKSPFEISEYFKHQEDHTHGDDHSELHDIHEHENATHESHVLLKYLDETWHELEKKGAHLLDLGNFVSTNSLLLSFLNFLF